MTENRIPNAETAPEGTKELSGKGTAEAPAEEPKDYVFATARICAGPENGTYVIELFSGIRLLYDLRKYKELSTPEPAITFLKRMLSSCLHDSLSISGVPMRRILSDRKAANA